MTEVLEVLPVSAWQLELVEAEGRKAGVYVIAGLSHRAERNVV